MRLRRVLAAAVATALAAPVAVLATSAAPASAAVATKIVGGTDGKPWIYRSSYATQPGVPVFGDTLNLSIEVADANGAQVYNGTLTVQQKLAGKKSWKTIKTSSTAYLFDTIKAKGNATYRVLYSGSGDYSPSGAQGKVKVQRKFDIDTISGKRAGLKGKVSPKFKGKIVVLKKQGKKWKKWKTVRTNKKSRFVVYLPAPRTGRIYWQLKIGSTKAFSTTNSIKYYTY